MNNELKLGDLLTHPDERGFFIVLKKLMKNTNETRSDGYKLRHFRVDGLTHDGCWYYEVLKKYGWKVAQ